MNDYEFAVLMCGFFEQAEKEAERKAFVMKEETLEKLQYITAVLLGSDLTVNQSFDRVTNAVDVEISGYVFDSVVTNLKGIFSIVDLFTIDALTDGTVCVEARILNACDVFDTEETPQRD